ncbi:unnamed protein product [Dibothriocephalus latus]|uniref:Peptidase A2 domain-containing protein n=1 Tax=Dibothriocephalus latus TaxID=60516 RepID=A0A3P7M083_DIBLA|nr:unnamed protein product [Dibothriocephalus latus]
MTKDQLKCLIFLKVLLSPCDSETRARLLSKIEQDLDCTLQTLTAECQRLKNPMHDSVIVEQPSSSFVVTNFHAVTRTRSMSPQTPQNSTFRKPPSACWQCGNYHFFRVCPFTKHLCQKFHKPGYKEDYCSTGQPPKSSTGDRKKTRSKRPSSVSGLKSHRILVRFQTQFEARRKPLTTNGKLVRLQFDTASDISLTAAHLADNCTASNNYIGQKGYAFFWRIPLADG